MSDEPETKKPDESPEADSKGATEDEVERIGSIRGDEVLGYPSQGREEHSGQNPPEESSEPEDELADNRVDQTHPDGSKAG